MWDGEVKKSQRWLETGPRRMVVGWWHLWMGPGTHRWDTAPMEGL